jgi:hypothetical protein
MLWSRLAINIETLLYTYLSPCKAYLQVVCCVSLLRINPNICETLEIITEQTPLERALVHAKRRRIALSSGDKLGGEHEGGD